MTARDSACGEAGRRDSGTPLVERRPEKVGLNLKISIVIGVNRTRAELYAQFPGQSASGIGQETGKGKGEKWFCGHMPRGLVGGAVAQRTPGASCFRFPKWSTARRLGELWPLTRVLGAGSVAGSSLALSPSPRQVFSRGFCALATPFARDT